MIKALIIDDESHAIEAIEILLKEFHDSVEIVGTSTSVSGGLQLLNKLRPDLVFLDIELKDGIGFEIVERTKHLSYKLIFTTAYNQYAIQAFKVRAIDYLLKPIDLKEFYAIMQHVIDHYAVTESQANAKPGVIKIPENDSYTLVPTHEILYLQADSNYTKIFTQTKSYILSKTLKEFESKLLKEDFCRVHHSYIVNLNAIKKLSKGEPLVAELSNGKQIPVSRARKKTLIARYKGND